MNEGSFIAATGQNFERALSRLTVVASDFNSNSTNRNTQFSSYDDLQYRITPDISALARIGYQNLRYPLAPLASFEGATWLAGGRLGLGPNYGYVSLEYGRQQGVYGFTGSADYQVTPTITVVANLVQGISSPGQYLQGSLASATLNPYGSIVDQYSGSPTAFYSPGLGLTNGVYKQHLFNGQITDSIGPNRYSLYGYYTNQQSLTPPITAPTKSVGGYATWYRDIRPRPQWQRLSRLRQYCQRRCCEHCDPYRYHQHLKRQYRRQLSLREKFDRVGFLHPHISAERRRGGGRAQRRRCRELVAVLAEEGVLSPCTLNSMGLPPGRSS